MKNFLTGVIVTLAALVLLGADKKPVLTLNGSEVHEIRLQAPLTSSCSNSGNCEISISK